MIKRFAAVAWILTAVAMMVFSGPAATQQAYPSKAIRIIVPYPAGGGISILARLIGQKLTESWGQQVLVDNRPGGNTVIASEALLKAPLDGYTLLFVTSAHVINPGLLSTSYDAIRDFAAVATVSRSEFILMLHPSLPANNLKEFIALAKSRPGQLNYASSGNGTTNHLASEFFKILAGIDMQHIPYKGGAQSLADLLGGQVHVSINTPPTYIPHIKSGRIKAIAVSGAARMLSLPQVPTFSEAGLPGFELGYWNGILAAAGTPKEVIDKLSAEIGKILAMPDIKEKLVSEGADPFISTADQFSTLMRLDLAKYGKIIKAANIKLEQ